MTESETETDPITQTPSSAKWVIIVSVVALVVLVGVGGFFLRKRLKVS